MIYLSVDYILSAINQLAAVHPFMGITFLTCKKAGLPVGKITNFTMDNETKYFMDSIHKICPESDHYFQPYETIKGKQWVRPNYPSHGLQSINTRSHFSAALSHSANRAAWCWKEDYVSQIRKAVIKSRKRFVPIVPVAVWTMKDYPWPNTASIKSVVGKFIEEYNITDDEISTLFTEDSEFPNVAVFQEERTTWYQISKSLSWPPDVEFEGDTLSYLRLTNVGPCDNMEMNLSPHLNIITGDNGLGKTFLTDCAWWAMSGKWAGNEARPKYTPGSRDSSDERKKA